MTRPSTSKLALQAKVSLMKWVVHGALLHLHCSPPYSSEQRELGAPPRSAETAVLTRCRFLGSPDLMSQALCAVSGLNNAWTGAEATWPPRGAHSPGCDRRGMKS